MNIPCINVPARLYIIFCFNAPQHFHSLAISEVQPCMQAIHEIKTITFVLYQILGAPNIKYHFLRNIYSFK